MSDWPSGPLAHTLNDSVAGGSSTSTSSAQITVSVLITVSSVRVAPLVFQTTSLPSGTSKSANIWRSVPKATGSLKVTKPSPEMSDWPSGPLAHTLKLALRSIPSPFEPTPLSPASAVAGTLVRTMDSDRPAVTAALNTRFLSI